MSLHSQPTPQMLDVFCPMHMVVSDTGHITHVGPTIRKLRPAEQWIGLRFLEVFRLSRPREVNTMDELAKVSGRKLHLELRDPPRTDLKGVVVKNPNDDGFVINLSLGISILEAVRDFDLSSNDFAPTDLAIEMLYLVEAKSAAMEASRKLNLRLQGAKAAAEKQAFSDPLTGLENRRAMDIQLAQFVSRHQPFALMQVDLDYFKAVNDTLGHAAGDYVLLQVAAEFKAIMRSDDCIARVGGDEFVLLLPNMTDRDQLDVVGTRIIQALEEPREFNGQPCRISGSIGTAIWDASGPASPETLLDDADIALYASKRAGRGRQTFYEAHLREDAQQQGDAPARTVELWG